MTMSGMNEIAQTDTGLISRCERISDKLGKALALTIEISGQHYDEESNVVAGLDAANLTDDLVSWIRAIALKTDNLVTQLEYMKEQF